MSTYLKFIISIGSLTNNGKYIRKKTTKKIFHHEKVYCYRYFVDGCFLKILVTNSTKHKRIMPTM